MVKKEIFKIACGLVMTIAFTACSGDGIEGKWVEPVPGMENQMQGIDLEKGGKASSMNMATLQYEKWERKDNILILCGKSIGNHTTGSFSDTLTIERLTGSELVLRKGTLTINYKKQ